MSTTATRLITLVMLLQRRPNRKAGELAQALGVSVRTLHRYMTMLDEMGIPIYSERGPHGGFSLVRGYKMAPLVFTPEEAVAVYLGTSLVGEMWGRLYEGAAQGALAKLDNLLPDEQRHEVAWARRSLVATGMQRARAGRAGAGHGEAAPGDPRAAAGATDLSRPEPTGGAPAGARPLRAGLSVGLVVRHRLLPPARGGALVPS